MKKLVIIISAIIVLGIVGTVVGIYCYKNSPNYVMKQYKKAYDTKDQKLLEELIWLPDGYERPLVSKREIVDITYKETSTKEEAYEYMKNWMSEDVLEKSKIGKITNFHVEYYYDTDKKSGTYCYVIKINGKYKIIDISMI